MKPTDDKALERRRRAQEKINAHWTPQRRKEESEKAKARWKMRKARLQGRGER